MEKKTEQKPQFLKQHDLFNLSLTHIWYLLKPTECFMSGIFGIKLQEEMYDI